MNEDWVKKILICLDDVEIFKETAFEPQGRFFSQVQICADPDALESSLKSKDFDLVLIDVAQSQKMAASQIEALRAAHRDTIFLVDCNNSHISDVIMRYNVGGAVLPTKDPQEALADNLDHAIVGSSKAIGEIIDRIQKISRLDSRILITGETGSGKELIARNIQRQSPLAKGPFVAINCGAIPSELLESELFGYRKGAFTDARTDRKGLFEQSAGGVLFLDEVGELSLDLQVKLLRVLQEGEVTPIGSRTSIKLNNRVIAATNRDLRLEVQEGRFRSDLYFRLNVIKVHCPPLRERKEDVVNLFLHFIKLFSHQYQIEILPPKQSICRRVEAYSWPGNIRELKNSVERAVVLSSSGHMNIKQLLPSSKKVSVPQDSLGINIKPSAYSEEKSKFERDYLVSLLNLTRGNISEASRISGQYRANLYRMLKKHGIEFR